MTESLDFKLSLRERVVRGFFCNLPSKTDASYYLPDGRGSVSYVTSAGGSV